MWTYSDEEVFVRRNSGRHVVPRTVGELPATVPASSGALVMAGLLLEHEFPSNTQRSRRMGSTPKTAGEPETTVPASHSALVAGGKAVDDVPPTLLDALEEDLESTVLAPGDDTVLVQLQPRPPKNP